MTESEWLASSDPAAMLKAVTSDAPPSGTSFVAVPRIASDRNLRLFACAVSRVLGSCPSEHIDAVEAWADGGPRPKMPPLNERWPVSDDDAAAVARLAATEPYGALSRLLPDSRDRQAAKAAVLRDLVGNPFRPVTLPPGPPCVACEGVGMARCRPAHSSRRACLNCDGTGHQPCPWLTRDVRALALAAYDERADDGTLDPLRLAVLSDALEEAGCPSHVPSHWIVAEKYGNEETDLRLHHPHPVLAHLRSPGPHYRGCWTVDLILGRS